MRCLVCLWCLGCWGFRRVDKHSIYSNNVEDIMRPYISIGNDIYNIYCKWCVIFHIGYRRKRKDSQLYMVYYCLGKIVLVRGSTENDARYITRPYIALI